ncbi:retrotransposon protein, putative, ty1-copia subclass [Tanacetum coccineum]
MMGYSFYYPPQNKVLVAQNAEFFENSLITHEESGSLEDLEIIQDEDTHPFENTSLHHDEDNQEIYEPQSDIIRVRRSTRTQHAPDRMCLYVDIKEHELGDLNAPDNYKATFETVSSKWLFKKKTNVDGHVRTYKAYLVVKGFTQTYGIDSEETFSLITDIRPIRILIAIAGYYDYEIWKIDVKTAFLNEHLYKEAIWCSLKCFAVKDLGKPAYVLGIKIYRDRSRRLIGLCQSAYIEKILKIFNMENFKRGSILIQARPKLSKSQGASTPDEVKHMQRVPYASVVGSIMYATAVKNILKYLWNTKDMFLVYGSDIKRELKKSTKQGILATSSAKGEYIAVVDASKDAVWVRKFISGLGVVPTNKVPMKMYCYNTRPITIANEPGITKGARHYRIKVHYLHKVIELGDIVLEKIHTDDNVADLLPKALPFNKRFEHTRSIGLLPTSSLM